MQQTSNRVTDKFSAMIKILAERQEVTERFMEQQKEAAVSEATARLSDLEERVQKLRASQVKIAALHNLSDTELIKVWNDFSSLLPFTEPIGKHYWLCQNVSSPTLAPAKFAIQ